ncbi:MAG: glycosyltransferase family 4 protein [Clostridia bacterium]|nr:glycosyltransferase family 4 protein [Clostridia bacterium]
MRILHYFLGFPPYRTGGLTKFAYDLMCSQVESGNEVVAVWPGKINFFINKDKIKLKKRKNIKGIQNYEIINPLPISLDEGIIDIDKYTKSNSERAYLEFFDKIKPDSIHIHTLMGLHKEFVKAAKLRNIKTIYTTHDYFGICPKVTLYRFGEVCNNDFGCKECVRCNYSALSMKKIILMQSPLYRKLKNSKIVKILRKKHRKSFLKEELPEFKEDEKDIIAKQKKYQELRQYYIDILENIDIIHFNSKLSKEIYSKYVNVKDFKIIPITHKDIIDNRNIEHIANNDKIRFTFLASTKPYKGIYLIKKVLDELYTENKYDFELNVFGDLTDPSPYMNINKDGFKKEELPEIFSKTDILLAPSIWYETFGFTVLEALSYGVPVIVSDNVGAKDIVGKGGIIVKHNDLNDLRKEIENLSKEKINSLKDKIKKEIKIKEWNEFCSEIEGLYKE